MALLPPLFTAQFFTDSGEVAAGYLLDTFESGTLTPKDSYTDQAGASENTNPIVLDAAGRCNLWLDDDGEYRLRLRTPDGLTTVWTRDDVGGVPVAVTGDYLPLAGGTMEGAIELPGNAGSALEAVPKQQLDSAIAVLSASLAATAATAVPVGTVALWLTASPPTGWLHLNGQAVSRTTYDDLFALWGTTFGAGNGTTTFNVPDVRGEFPRFWDASRGVDSGRGIGTAQAADIAAHTHSLSTLGHAEADSQSTESSGLVGSAIGAAGALSNATAASTGAETRPRNFALMAIVKAA